MCNFTKGFKLFCNLFCYICNQIKINTDMEYSNQIVVGQLAEANRIAFFKKTYSHLALGVLAFMIVEYLFLSSETITKFALSLVEGRMWLLMLGGFMLVTNIAEKMAINSIDRNKQYLGFGLYIIAEAFIFVPLLYIAMYKTGSFVLIKQAAILTISLFAGLTLVAMFSKSDFSFLRRFLTIGFMIALGLIVAGLIFGFNLGLWFSAAMVILASGSILYQTSNIIYRYGEEQYVAAALGLFASLMLLFWYILRILMSRK